jgi:AAA family ATP:ADP antiporter
MSETIETLRARLTDLRPGELRAVVWSFLYFFCLLASYLILRPLRDEMGVAAGRDFLQYLFTATFLVMLVASPIFSGAIARLPRRRFIPLVYRFFIINLIIFWALLTLSVETIWTARVFFVWVSVFNLFAVSVFWSFMADIWRTEQGKRLFGLIAAGGTAGTLLGSTITLGLTGLIGPTNLLIAAALLLELAVFCASRLERAAEQNTTEARRVEKPMGGDMLAGFRLILGSPYLAGIATWVALLSLAGTFLYFIQQDVVRAASSDPATRTRIFAAMDLGANLLTISLQFLATGQLIKRLGAGPAAAALPLVFAAGFAGLVIAPGLAAIVVFQTLQRTINFAFSNPAREILFTSVAREEKYKAKNLIDTVVFRGGDVVWSWTFAGLLGLVGSPLRVAMLAIPVMIGWAGLALALGRKQEKKIAAPEEKQA